MPVREQSPPGEDDRPEGSDDFSHDSAIIQSTSISGMPMHMFTFPATSVSSPASRTKRRQVKNACTNCQKACKKCDDARPCLRCVKYGIADECVDSSRKERKKGVKRGPYKKRDGKTPSISGNMLPESEAVTMAPMIPVGIPGGPGSPLPMIAATPVGYPPAFYGQFPSLVSGLPAKPGETQGYQIYVVGHPALPGTHESGGAPYAPSQFYPATIMQYAPPYQAYMVPHPGSRVEGQMMTTPAYAYPFVSKLPQAEVVQGEHNERRD